MSVTTDLTGRTSTSSEPNRLGSALGVKNVAHQLQYAFQDNVPPVNGAINVFIGIADPSTDHENLNDRTAPVGSLFIRLTSINATTGAPEAAELYFKKVKASSGVSGFAKVTTA